MLTLRPALRAQDWERSESCLGWSSRLKEPSQATKGLGKISLPKIWRRIFVLVGMGWNLRGRKKNFKKRKVWEEHYWRLQVPTTEQSQKAKHKHQCKAGKECGHTWTMRWGKLECHKETFDLCLFFIHLSKFVSELPNCIGRRYNKMEKCSYMQIYLGRASNIFVQNNYWELFGLKGENPPKLCSTNKRWI